MFFYRPGSTLLVTSGVRDHTRTVKPVDSVINTMSVKGGETDVHTRDDSAVFGHRLFGQRALSPVDSVGMSRDRQSVIQRLDEKKIFIELNKAHLKRTWHRQNKHVSSSKS